MGSDYFSSFPSNTTTSLLDFGLKGGLTGKALFRKTCDSKRVGCSSLFVSDHSESFLLFCFVWFWTHDASEGCAVRRGEILLIHVMEVGSMSEEIQRALQLSDAPLASFFFFLFSACNSACNWVVLGGVDWFWNLNPRFLERVNGRPALTTKPPGCKPRIRGKLM